MERPEAVGKLIHKRELGCTLDLNPVPALSIHRDCGVITADQRSWGMGRILEIQAWHIVVIGHVATN